VKSMHTSCSCECCASFKNDGWLNGKHESRYVSKRIQNGSLTIESFSFKNSTKVCSKRSLII
ncbi:hypothetical protein TELCIR_22652, partial [Teladorsagia circumcincta]